MHPNTLNEMQRNLIEISYRPEIKSICHLYAELQELFSLNEFIARIPDCKSSNALPLFKSLETTNHRDIHTIP